MESSISGNSCVNARLPVPQSLEFAAQCTSPSSGTTLSLAGPCARLSSNAATPARRAIVERHGGGISVASSPNAGTTFTVELPLAAAGTSSPPAFGNAQNSKSNRIP